MWDLLIPRFLLGSTTLEHEFDLLIWECSKTWFYSQVAKSVKTVLRANQAIVSVKLDMKRIDALQLDINSDTVAHAIVRTPKIKLKHVVSLARAIRHTYLNSLLYSEDFGTTKHVISADDVNKLSFLW
jgi:hypothetical protein